MVRPSSEIDPAKEYTLQEAAKYLPSCRDGKHVHPDTLHRWRRAGRFKAEYRISGGIRWCFISGAELLRLARMQEYKGASSC